MNPVPHADRHYVPVLWAKDCEYLALRSLEAGRSAFVTPLFRTPGPKDQVELAEKSGQMRTRLLANWGVDRPFYFEPDVKLPDTTRSSLIAAIVPALRQRHLWAIPIIRPDATYLAAATKLVRRKPDCGLGIRLVGKDLIDKATLSQRLTSAVSACGLTDSQTDLFIDMGSVAETADQLAATLPILLKNVPRVARWRSLVLIASAFSGEPVPANTTTAIARSDWMLWSSLQDAGLQRMPTFADSGPEILSRKPGGGSLPVPYLRYADRERWLIHRAKESERKSPAGYRRVLKRAMAHESYSGSDYSWADAEIARQAKLPEPSISPALWVRVAFNRHFSLTIDQLGEAAAEAATPAA